MDKRILAFGDSNTWGYDARTGKRFGKYVRWTGVLQKLLDEEYTVIEEGLSGRTTVFDDPLHEGLNGLKYLYPCLETHKEIDLLIIMLGTNDCKARFAASSKNIADGAARLIKLAKSLDVWKIEASILLISPGPIEKGCESSLVAGKMGICSDKSYELAKEYKIVAKENDCYFLDASEYVKMNDIDYMHLDEESHTKLGKALAEFIERQIIWADI